MAWSKIVGHNVAWIGKVAIHTTPKVASSSLIQAIKGRSERDWHNVKPDEPGPDWRFMVIRHPLDRLVSAWAFFTQGNQSKSPPRSMQNIFDLGAYIGMPFDEWLDIVIPAHHVNGHTRQQHLSAGSQKIDQLVRFEHIDRGWGRLMSRYPDYFKPLGHSNKSKDVGPWEDFYTVTARKLAEYAFSKDLALYEGAEEP